MIFPGLLYDCQLGELKSVHVFFLICEYICEIELLFVGVFLVGILIVYLWSIILGVNLDANPS